MKSDRPLTAWMQALALGALLAGCAANPDDDGACTLSCANPRVASAQFVVEPMVPAALAEDGIALLCSPTNDTADAEGPVMVQFRVYERRTRFGYPDSHQQSGGGGGDTGAGFAMQDDGGGEASPLAEPILEPRMIGGIAFQPVVYGRMAAGQTNEEHRDGTNGATPWKFSGIVTPSSEWCSDSCGVMTYEFWPSCPPGGQLVQAGIGVQGVRANSYVTFSLSRSE